MFRHLLTSSLLLAVASAQSTTRVSVDSVGGELPDGSLWPHMTADARFIAWPSNSPALPADANGASDIYVLERTTGQLTLASVTATGVQANGDNFEGKLSDDGRFCAFQSRATNLAVSDTNGAQDDIYVKDLWTGAIEHVSAFGNGASQFPEISGNGLCVVFVSDASNLAPNDNNGVEDVFLYDRQSQQIECISVNANGVPRGGDNPVISFDGSVVAFETRASITGLPGAANRIVRVDRANGVVQIANLAAPGVVADAFGPRMSADGRTVAFYSMFPFSGADVDLVFYDVYAFYAPTESHLFVSAPGLLGSTSPPRPTAVSTDGRFIGFRTDEAYEALDTNGGDDAYVFDVLTGQYELLSVHWNGAGAAGPSGVEAISSNGRFALLVSSSFGLVANDYNGAIDTFLRDRCGPADWRNYGSGWAGSAGVPAMSFAGGGPVIGTAATLFVGNGTTGNAAGLLVLGIDSATIATPVGGTLLVDPLLVEAIVVPPGGLARATEVPDVFDLCGLRYYLQALLLDPAAATGVAFTPGLEATIGG